MKVGGPKPPPIKPSLDAADKAKAVSPGTASTEFARALEGAPKDAAPATGSPAASKVAEVVEQVRVGKLDGPEAARQMIEKIVVERAAALTPELRVKLREALERTLADDPHLAAKVRQLAKARDEER